jgi:hypothetical protein
MYRKKHYNFKRMNLSKMIFLIFCFGFVSCFCDIALADYFVDETCNPAYSTIVGVGGTTGLNQGDDDADNVTIPFDFLFYEGRYTTVRIQSNGAVYFSPTSGTIPFTNQSIPYSSVTAMACPFWDDLNPVRAGDVYWAVRGTAPNREFVVEWYNVPHYNNTGNATIQMILHEGSDNITFLYPDVNFGDASYDNGRSATIGLQRDSSYAQGYSNNTASVSSGSAICYTYPKDYSDALASYGAPSNGGQRVTDVFLGTNSDSPDVESSALHSADALGDDNDGADDENGVTFRSPVNTGQSIYADVVVNNSSGANVTVCGWLDVPSGGTVDGVFDASDGQCQTTNATNPTLTFQWSGMPSDQQYTTYARFRISTDNLSTSTPATSVFNGEVEDYRIIFDFRPTFALIDHFRVEQGSTFVGYDAPPVKVKDGAGGLLRWETVQEHGTVGFYVERQIKSGQWIQLNDGKMLPGLISSPLGGEYALVDPDVRSGETVSYRLIEEDIWGAKHTYGPWIVKVGADPLAADLREVSLSAKTFVEEQFQNWHLLAPDFSGRARKEHLFKTSSANKTSLTPLPFRKAVVFGAATKHVNRVRLKTRDTAMYQVTLNDLAVTTGIEPTRIERKILRDRWSFFTGSGAASYFYDADDQMFYFAADTYQTIDTLDNVYQLGKFRRHRGWKMAPVVGSGPTAGTPGQFRDTLYFAEKKYLLTWLHSDEDADYGYWEFVFSMPEKTKTVDLTVNIPDPAAQAAEEGVIKVVLRGASDKAQGDDHLARISLNGTQLPGEVRWDGKKQVTLAVPFDQSLLAGTESGEVVEATVSVSGQALNGAEYSLFYIESVEISYARKMFAREDALRLHNTEPDTVLTVSGFSTNNIKVIESPNTPQAAWRKDLTITESADGYQVSFISSGSDYQLSAAPVQLAPEPDFPSRLLARSNRADYLIIAPRVLQQSAESLATYRSSRFLTKIIWLQDIYDVFSAGRVDSAAIEKFLQYVHARWQQVPEYVVLLGRGTLDHPDRRGLGESLIPLRMAATPWGLIGTDNRYADVNGDYVPDFSLGRIAVSTDAAGQAYVDKIQAYEAQAIASWATNAAVVADDPDPDAGDFHANSDEIADLLTGSGLTVEKIYHPDQQVRDTLLANWSAGTYGLVNYDGHGGRTQLGKSSENFLNAADVEGLQNGIKLPVFAALTCAAGDSSYPGMLSLGDTLSLQADGGAIVSFVPKGLSLDSPAHQLNKAFVQALAGERLSVGRAARSALESLNTTGMVPFMFDMYGVAGDPAVQMKQLEGYRISDGPSLEINE